MKIKNYDIACLSLALGLHPKKIEGSYMVSINLDNKYHFLNLSVKNPEEGLKIIKEHIVGYSFDTQPDLDIKETNILGKFIFTKHYERNSIN